MKYYLIAGEASGDLHASNLMKSIKLIDANAQFRFFGGDKMNNEGGETAMHIREISFMGFWDVLSNFKKIFKIINFCKKDILAWKPDALILIDYPGFNLRIAKFAKSTGLNVFYYISPKVWAWNTSRINSIKKAVDKLFVIFPFEKEFYKKYQYEVEYVGHPLIEVIDNWKPEKDFASRNTINSEKVIALLPGSRKQEIKMILPSMLSVAENFKNYQFILAATSPIENTYYESFLKEHKNIKIIYDHTYDILSVSDAALITSGTANLEAALLKVPQVVCYKTGMLNYCLGKLLIKVKHLSPVNLIEGKEVIKELIQGNLSKQNLLTELIKLINGKNEIIINYQNIENKIRVGEKSSMIAAKIVINSLVNCKSQSS